MDRLVHQCMRKELGKDNRRDLPVVRNFAITRNTVKFY